MREQYRKEIVKLFFPGITRIFLSSLQSHFHCGSRTVMAIRDINLLNILKCLINRIHIFFFRNFPYAVCDAVYRRKIINRRLIFHIRSHDIMNAFVRTVRKENRSGLGRTRIHMSDTVNFLVFSGIFMFLNNVIHIIIYRRAGNKSGLGTSVHHKLVNIVTAVFIRNIYAFLLVLLQKFFCLLIYFRRIRIHVVVKIGLCAVNFQK